MTSGTCSPEVDDPPQEGISSTKAVPVSNSRTIVFFITKQDPVPGERLKD
jgi:hypothetical protein